MIRESYYRWVVLVLCATALIFPVLTLAQTNIEGVVNTYVAVTRVVQCDSLAYVKDERGFAPGDRVMLIQMSGLGVNTTNAPTYGDLLDLNMAGAVDLLTIKSIRGTAIYFTTPPTFPFEPQHVVQLVRIATYASARVVRDVRAKPYDGETGGVLAIECTDELILDANLNADTAGYRGGATAGIRSLCGDTTYSFLHSSEMAGDKGESACRFKDLAGRGKLYAAGGGGNTNNSGGGGGGNGGHGGGGGDATRHCYVPGVSRIDVGGVGGAPTVPELAQHRLFMGSGGGGGHQNQLDDTTIVFTGTSGGRGGGLIYVRSSRILSARGIITADGQNITDTAGYDGAGAGGAGGTIVVDCPLVSNNLLFRARGGFGGDIGTTPELGVTYNGHGPGGGGGGGILVLLRPTANYLANLDGGHPGTHLDSGNEAFQQHRNAQAGETGTVVQTFTWNTFTIPMVRAYGDSVLCPGSTGRLTADSGFVRYVWSNGTEGQHINVGAEGPYSVTAYDSMGCPRYSNTVNVRWNPSLYQSPGSTNLGSGDIGETLHGGTVLVNTDDEPIIIEKLVATSPFFVEYPVVFPHVIQPGERLEIGIGFTGTAAGTYGGTLQITVGLPCLSSFTTELTANVNPMYAVVDAGEVTAQVGSKNVAVPVLLTITPDSLQLPDVHIRLVVSFDRRTFAPTSVAQGRIVRDVIDITDNLRTITIDLPHSNVSLAKNLALTTIVGTALAADIKETAVHVDSVLWGPAARKPITTRVDGHVLILPGCFGSVRAVYFDEDLVHAFPNPVAQDLSIHVQAALPGHYDVLVISSQGETVYRTQAIADADEGLVTVLNMAGVANGPYVVTIRSGLGVLATVPVTVLH